MVDITGKSFFTAQTINGEFENITELSMKLGTMWIEFQADFDSDNLIISGKVPVSAIQELVKDQAERNRIQEEVDRAEI